VNASSTVAKGSNHQEASGMGAAAVKGKSTEDGQAKG
jgi:hypothetical protein